MNSNQRKPVGGKSNRVDEEVSRLLNKRVSSDEFLRLRNKYSNDQELVDQIQIAYTEKYSQIEKRAKVFAQKILEKYGLTNEPFSSLLLKAHKYKQKYSLSDDEFAAFKRILESELVGAKRPDVPKMTTNMGKVLGDITLDVRGFGMKVSDADYRDLQDILKMYEETKPLHSQVILQSLSYSNCGEEAMNSVYKPELGHNLANHVHPIVAALFLPKIKTLEEYFLYANMANVVKARYNQEPFTTRPDYELFYNLITDPNDVVCDSRSAVKDLKNRVNLQKYLWNAVLALRNSNHFAGDQVEFMRAVDMCRLNKYDTPDLVYGRYDGTVFKRLLSAFSFRPTVVASVPSASVVSSNPYFQNQTPQVSQISMINLRMGGHFNHDGPEVDLKEALSQAQLFFENGMLVTKNTDVIYSRGILNFFVDRRATSVRIGAMHHPFDLGRLPVATSGFERINEDSVKFQNRIDIRGDGYHLRSVVCAETTELDGESDNKVITGSSTFVIKSDGMTEQVFKYDPMEASAHKRSDVVGNGNVMSVQGPIPMNSLASGVADVGYSFTEVASKRGIIFIFEAEKEVSKMGTKHVF